MNKIRAKGFDAPDNEQVVLLVDNDDRPIYFDGEHLAMCLLFGMGPEIYKITKDQLLDILLGQEPKGDWIINNANCVFDMYEFQCEIFKKEIGCYPIEIEGEIINWGTE